MSQHSSEFLGTNRFRIRRRLGSGGMGVVYEAHDQETDKLVALKTLTRAEASHISRFKQEFRSLADVSHPNLVGLYEFMADGHYWFFTMELVQGVNFLEYVRPGYHARRGEPSRTPTLRKSTQEVGNDISTDYEAVTRQMDELREIHVSDDGNSDIPTDTSLSRSHLDSARLRAALRQLAEGLHGLHETGKLHRDIKPSNVLVTKEGRVVILDFGLVAEVEGKEMHESMTLAGTPDYMSPEQGAQLPISRASDWYSVGVMLYQSLTAKLPFSGKFFEVMINKQNVDPPAPSELVRGVPADLNDLCVRLLRRNPEERPSGREILQALGSGTSRLRPITAVPPSPQAQSSPFVGREQQSEKLAEAFALTRKGQTVTVYLHGSSGMGKTALAHHFLDGVREVDQSIVILKGRCYERESVPYKALDGVIDSLTKYLMSLPEARAEALMPRDVPALARLFPVINQVDSVFNAPQRDLDIPDPFALRRRAFAALRELLGRISDRQPLILYIDDLQWSDADSTMLLEDLLRPPDAPPLLLISSFRSEDIETKPFLSAMLEKTGSDTCREVLVDALTKGQSLELVRDLLGAHASAVEPFTEGILREARGNPFLLEQLARYAATNDQTATSGITLTTMLESRLRQQPKGARQFLNTLAVAGRPINPEVVYQAANLSGDEFPLVSSLRAAQFLRSGGEGHTVEIYHDRIRETLASQVDPATATQIHRGLAQAIEARGLDDPEALFEHYLGAGERVRAATHAGIAARKAASALAFDRAAAFYRRALELAPVRDAELIDLKRGLAEALANAGRPAEAAQAYLELAPITSASHSLNFKRRAAEQLLMGGHIIEGLELIKSVLTSVGFTLPAGPKLALLSLLYRRLQIRLRGFKFTERRASDIPESDLFRIDICWGVTAGLGVVDLIRGADFQGRHLLLALRAGEPYRVARALAFEAVQTATRGGGSRKRHLQIAQRAEEVAARVGHPHAIGLAKWAIGAGAYLIGDWERASEFCERAAEILRDRCTGVAWELTTANRFMLSAFLYRGEIGEVSRRVPVLLAAALDQGNVFAAMDIRTRLNLIWLAADDPTRARSEVIEGLKAWAHEGFHLQHYTSMHALVQIELYTGDSEVAWRHVQGQWKSLEQSMLLRIQILRIEALHLRARAALASAIGSGEKNRVDLAEKSAARIEREKMTWGLPFAILIRAAVAQQRGDREAAVRLLTDALERFDRERMYLYAAASRHRLGELLGGERGEQLKAQADAWMVGQKILNPPQMVQMLAPGL